MPTEGPGAAGAAPDEPNPPSAVPDSPDASDPLSGARETSDPEPGAPAAPPPHGPGAPSAPPGHSPAPPGRARTPARPGVGEAPVTMSLLVVVVAVFALTESTALGERILVFGIQYNPLVLLGEWWRVLTATLLHGSLAHLFFNGYALYALGVHLERGVGSAAFAALYIASGLAGGLAYLLAVPDGSAVGASGAIFGLFGAWFAASWVNRDTPQGRAGVSQFGLLLLINLALPLFVPNIAWQAHLGGLVAGGAIGLVWASAGRRRRTRPASRTGVAVGVAVALLLGLLWYTMS